LQSEKQLIKFIPEHQVPRAHHWLILHGRYVCLARSPKCGICNLKEYCKYFEKLNAKQNKVTIVKQKNKISSNGKEIKPKKSGKKAD
jgi:endonuclease-3